MDASPIIDFGSISGGTTFQILVTCAAVEKQNDLVHAVRQILLNAFAIVNFGCVSGWKDSV